MSNPNISKAAKEASFKAADIEPPEYLYGVALERWNELVPELHANGLLTVADVDAFADYCEYYAQKLEANELLKIEGFTVPGRGGNGTVKNPNWQVRREASENMMKLALRFGLNPSARAALRVESKKRQSIGSRLGRK